MNAREHIAEANKDLDPNSKFPSPEKALAHATTAIAIILLYQFGEGEE